MDIDDYQAAALSTAIYPNRHSIFGIAYCALGLNGEAGEVAEKIKKALRDSDGDVDVEATKKELGDTLWYAAVLADELGLKLSDVATANLAKLSSRKESGTLRGSGDNR